MKWTMVVVMMALALEHARGQVDTLSSAAFSRLHITCTSDSALVSLDGRAAGVTPVIIDSVVPGTHIVRVFQHHPSSWLSAQINDTVRLNIGESRTLLYSFPSMPIPTSSNEFHAEVIEDGIRTTPKTNLYISGAAAVLAGSAAAYFKIKADDRHDAYLLTNDPSLRDQYRRFDTFSAISLIVAQTGIALFAYYLLSQ